MSTRPSDDSGTSRWDECLRIASISLMAVIFLAGLVGFLGVRSATATASGDGLSVEVTYAAITRAGLATPFDLRVTTEDGSPLPATVTTRIGSAYLAMFDENGLAPQPVSTFQSDEWTWWTFEVAQGASLLEVSLDARLEPGVQWGQGSTAAVEIADQEIVAVEFDTWVMP
jgi:hypothetical protein